MYRLESLTHNYKIETFEHAHFEPYALNFLGDTSDESYILLTPEDRRWSFSEKHSIAYPYNPIKLGK
jgi:hypothetical protein